MIRRGIEIPSELIAQGRANQLVVFVGAGVSMDSPSSLPSFDGLADEIARGTGESPLAAENSEGHSTLEPLDRFLGRLEQDWGVEVHLKASQILASPMSEPNRLHRLVVKLFGPSGTPRIVTTNFDRHLEGALGDQRVEEARSFVAPALPLGSDFEGIVYVHGRLGGDPKNLVLTDRDFGRAYLTEGWARRFLRGLFSTYDVLFVGYSHNDPVVSYLARGLPPDSERKRYALTAEGRSDHWKLLGIEPIEYATPGGSHERSAELLEDLGLVIGRGASGHEEELKKIVGRGVAELDAEGRDFLLWLLESPLRHLFFSHTKDAEWTAWMNGVGQLAELFDGRALDRDLNQWFARDPLGEPGHEALHLLSNQPGIP
ncbi:MAG: SIR2 family protein, partial [Acidobacteriota bacterium]